MKSHSTSRTTIEMPAALRTYATLLALAGAAALALPANARPDGSYFPNAVLTDQDGKPHRFYDDMLKGKIVAVNFIYTSCGDACPTETAQLRRVQELLGPRLGRDVFMYSISIDPERDTPAALKRYMHMFDVKPGWSFFTGSLEDVTLIQKKFGLEPAERRNLKTHAIAMLFGNETTGEWIKRSPFDEPAILANLLTDRLRTHGGERVGNTKPYEQARQIEESGRGAYLFRTRCAACHTMGEGDRLGPDLRGVVAARPRDWLIRWLKEPDKMLAEKDPLALALKAKYRNIPMPNLGLGDVEAAALIEYMAAADAKLEAKETAAHHTR